MALGHPCRLEVSIRVQADPTRHPLTCHWQRQQPLRQALGLVPDALLDSSARRRRRASTLFGDGRGILARLWAAGGGQLVHAVVPLPQGLNLYFEAPQVAREELARVFGQVPRYVRVCLGRTGHVHVHALLNAVSLSDLTRQGSWGRVHLIPVRDDRHLRCLAEYFARPYDERAARPSSHDRQRYSRAELEAQLLEASEVYLHARRHRTTRNLPRLSWTSHLPLLRAARTSQEPHLLAQPSRPLSVGRAPGPADEQARPFLPRLWGRQGGRWASRGAHHRSFLLGLDRTLGRARGPPNPLRVSDASRPVPSSSDRLF